MQARMHIAVDDAQPVLRRGFRFKQRAVDDVAHAILLGPSRSLCGEREPRKGFKRIVGAHPRDQACGEMRRYRVVAVELPVRIIRREQKHLSEPIMSMMSATPAASGGASN